MKSNLTGQAVVHEDGDPGVITHDAGTGWDVRFCSGYKGHFPLPVGKDDGFPFAFMPTIHAGYGDEKIDPEVIYFRLGVLREIIDLVEKERSNECDAIWTKHCRGWLGSDEFKSLVAKREWIRDTKLREALRREVLDLVDALKVSEAPAATPNSPNRGQVKIPQLSERDGWMVTRSPDGSQREPLPP